MFFRQNNLTIETYSEYELSFDPLDNRTNYTSTNLT